MVYARGCTCAAAAVYFLPCFAMCLLVVLADRDGPPTVSTTNCYPTTSIPMERAVPRTVLIAASRSWQLRSGIFCLAMSSTCFAVTVPTLLRFGSADPL